MSAVMLAAVPDNAGAVDVVEVPVPEPAAGEALIRVHAAGMNRADLLHARGKYAQALRVPGRPNVAGMEFAGTVVGLGDGVRHWQHGDEVMALFPGAYADFIAVDARLLLPAPSSHGWTHCGGLPMGLLTEFEAMIRLARLKPGERVLITGATSGVGLLGLQLAQVAGAGTVIGTSRERDSDALLLKLGADAVAHDAAELVETCPEGFDLVIDHVAGGLLAEITPLLRKYARVVSVGRLGGREVNLDLAAFSARRAVLIGSTWKAQSADEVAESVRALGGDILQAVLQGRVLPPVSAELPLADIAAGYRLLSEQRPPGKLVILPHQREA